MSVIKIKDDAGNWVPIDRVIKSAPVPTLINKPTYSIPASGGDFWIDTVAAGDAVNVTLPLAPANNTIVSTQIVDNGTNDFFWSPTAPDVLGFSAVGLSGKYTGTTRNLIETLKYVNGRWLPYYGRLTYETLGALSASTLLLIRFQGVNNSTIIDRSFTPKTLQVFGDTKILNNVGVFDGNSDYIRIAKSVFDITNLETYTMQIIYKPTIQDRILLTTYNLPNQANHLLLLDNALSNGLGNYSNFTSNLNVNNHLALTRSAGVFKIWLNGTLVNAATGSSFLQGGDFFIGGSPGDNNIGGKWFSGDMTAIKVTNTLDYTVNFTPPTSL